MKNHLKRLVSILCAVMMMVGNLSIPAVASEVPFDGTQQNAEILDVNTEQDVILSAGDEIEAAAAHADAEDEESSNIGGGGIPTFQRILLTIL